MRKGYEIKNAFLVLVRVLTCVWFSYYVNDDCFNLLLYVYLGGASCQIEGREDPSCLGENQGGAGQKGRTTSVLLCPHSHSRTSLFTPTHNNHCHIRCPLHFFVNFIHSEAVERGENRSLQCLIVCICWGGSKESERGFRKESAARQCRRILHKTSYLHHATKRALIFGEQLGALLH